MANDLKINIDIEAEVKKATQKINTYFADLEKKAAASNKKLNTNLSTGLGQFGFVGNQVKNATEFGKVYTDKFKPAVDGLRQSVAKLYPTLKTNDLEILKFAGSTVTLTNNLDKGVKAIDPFSKNLWLMSAGLQKLSSVLIPASAAIIGFTTVAIKSYSDLEKSTDDLQASLGTNETVAKTLQKQFQGLSMQMPTTTKEFLTMAQSAAEAGVAEEYIVNFTKSMGMLQNITNELDIDNVSEALVNISKAFGISLGNIDKTISVLRNTAKASSVTMDDFVGSLRRASPSAHTLGISLQETSAILGTLIPVQESAERTGTRLNNIFTRMATRLPDLAEQMGITKQELRNMIDEDATGTLLTYIERLEQVGSSVEQVEKATTVFGEQGSKAIVALIGKTDEIRDSIKDLNEEFETGKTFQEDYAISIDNLASQFKILKNTSTVALQSIGADIAPLISGAISKLTNAIKGLVAWWVTLSEPTKKFIINLGLTISKVIIALTVFTGLALTLTSLSSGFATAYRSVLAFSSALIKILIPSIVKSQAAIKAFQVLTSLTLGKVVLIIMAVIAAVWLLRKGLEALGIKIQLPDFGDMINKAFKLDNLTAGFDKVDDALEDLEDNVSNVTNNIEKSFGSLNASALKWGNEFINNYISSFRKADFAILNDVASIVEQYYKIQEKAGNQSAEQAIINTEKTRGIVARAIDDIKEMGIVSQQVLETLQAEIGGSRTESIVKEITSALKIEDINESIDTIKDQIDDRKKKLEEETDLIDDEIKQVEDTYEPRIKAQETIIKDLEKQKKDLEKVYKTELKIYEEQADTAQASLESAKDALDSMKKLRDKEVDSAEGMVEYAKMNLEAAQNALKRETILGRDEFNASFRAAEERVKAAEQAVELAQTSYLQTKKSSEKEVDLAQNEVDILDKKYDIIKDNLNTYKDAYKEEVDVLDEKIDLAKENLTAIKDAQTEALDILKSEQSLLEDKYDEEVNILEAREDILKKSLEAEQEVYDKIKAIRDEYLRTVNAQLSAIKDASDILPETGGGQEDKEEVPSDGITQIDTSKINVSSKPKTISQWLFGKTRGELEKESEETGRSLSMIFIESFIEENKKARKKSFNNFLDLLLGKENIEKAKEDSKINGKTIGQNLIDGFTNQLNTSDIAKSIQKNILDPISTKIPSLETIGSTLSGFFITAFENGLNILKNIGNFIELNVIKPIQDEFSDMYNSGKDLLSNFLNGIWSKVSGLWKDLVYILGTVRNYFADLAGKAWRWGWDLLVSFVNGLIDAILNNKVVKAIKWVAQKIANFFESHSPPKEGPLSTIDKWGAGLMKSYAESLKDGLPYIDKSVSSIAKAIEAPLSAMDGVNISSDLNKNTSSPIASNPITNVTQEGSKTIAINPGVMIASEGEIRSFARMLQPYLDTENQRIAGGQNG